MDKFLDHVAKGFGKFGVEVTSSEELENGLQKMMLNDSVNNVYYAALAHRKDTSSPAKFWGKALDEILTPLIKNASEREGGTVPPSALVVPSVEAETLLKLASDRGASPTIYQLFDGYTVVGFKRSDSAALIRNLAPKKAEERKINEEEKTAEKKAERSNQSAAAEKSGGISPRKLAAAALLGVSLASIPFALNKVKDAPPESHTEEALSPEDAFIRDNFLESAIDGKREDKELLATLALKSDLGGENLKELSRSGYRLEVAANPHIGKVAEKLITSHNKELRAAVAANPSLPKELVARAAEDSSAAVRRKAAANPNLPLNALEKLARDEDLSVRSAALTNPNTTENILALVEPVFESASCDNIQKIYASPCMPQNRLAYHSKNPDPCVRRGIAQNPHTSDSVLKELAEDKDPSVKRAALANPAFKDIDVSRYFPVGWLTSDGIERKEERKALLSNPNIPLGLLKSAALEHPSEYGIAAANNPKTPPSLINALYSYAKGREGVPALFKELSTLPSNAGFMAEYREAKAHSPEEGDKLLKGAVKKSFKKNVFDPVKAVSFAKGEAPDKEEKELTLGDFTEGASEFFGDEDALLAEGQGGFEEFFGEETLTDFEKETLKTADKAVAGILAELKPALDGGGWGALGGGSGGAGAGGRDAGGSAGTGSLGSASAGTGAGGGGIGAPMPRMSAPSSSAGAFSVNLFKTTCEDIEKLKTWG